jgi:hypothetical protein
MQNISPLCTAQLLIEELDAFFGVMPFSWGITEGFYLCSRNLILQEFMITAIDIDILFAVGKNQVWCLTSNPEKLLQPELIETGAVPIEDALS